MRAWRQAITLTNADFSLLGPYEQTWVECDSKHTFIQENESQNVVCKMVAILSSFQMCWVRSYL